VSQVRHYRDGTRIVEEDFRNMRAEGNALGRVALARTPTDLSILDNFTLLDLRGQAVESSNLEIQVDAAVNEAYRYVEVYTRPQSAIRGT
jgi:hypothetical protein